MVQKKPGELAFGAFFVFLGVVIYISSLSFPERAQTSTAVYVRFTGSGMALLSALDMFQVFRKKGGTVELFSNKVYFIGLVGLMIVYLALMMLDLSFMIATIPFLIAAALLLGYRNWKVMGISFSLILIATYFIFFRLLQVPMP